MKKRLLAALAISALMLSACGGSNDSSSSSSDSSSSATSESSTGSTTGSTAHTHSLVFDSFVWTTTAGDYKAKAKYKCSANDGYEVSYDAVMTKTTEAPTHTADGANHWTATYQNQHENKDEVLPSPGHNDNGVGLCLADGYFAGKLATVGTNTESATYEAGKTYYFRAQANVGHTYSLANAGVTPSEVKTYYLNTNGEPVEYDRANVPFPSTGTYDSYIYFVHTPAANEEEASLRVNFKGHRVDDFGFCQDHPTVYEGQDFDTNDPIDFGALKAGEKIFRRFAANADHRYRLDIHSPLVKEDVHFALKTSESGYSSVDCLDEVNNKTIDNFADLSEDGYVYVRIEPVADRLDSGLTVFESHNYNALGLCLHDEVFIGGEDHTLEVGEQSPEIEFKKGTTYYFRVKAYAGHTYHMVVYDLNSGINVLEIGRIHENGNPISTDSIGNDYEFPEDTFDDYLYIVYNPQADQSGEHWFRVDLVSHPVDNEHGNCPHDGITKVLVDKTPYENFTLAADDYAFFKINIANTEKDEYGVFPISYGGSYYLLIEVWYSSNDTWVALPTEDQYPGSQYEEYYSAPEADDGFVYVTMHNTTGATINVNGFGTNIS